MSEIEKNTILFGPPGTGKTYHTVLYAVAIVEGKELETVRNEDYKNVLSRYNFYRKAGLIEFTTFHQSYGYEEFVEGIKPVVTAAGGAQNDDGADMQNAGEVQYEVKPGVFKQFCVVKENMIDYIERTKANVWRIVMGKDNEDVFVRFKNRGEIRMAYNSNNMLADRFEDYMKIGDIVLATYTTDKIFAAGFVMGEYCEKDDISPIKGYHFKHSRQVSWITPKGFEAKTMKFVEDNYLKKIDEIGRDDIVEDVRLIEDDRLIEIVQSEFRQILEQIPTDKKAYTPRVFIIDEINRGNISKIFGELITLTDDTKRLGRPEECRVRLPYSGELFGIPDNVYILGTMNTADRSIAAMDTALRRRFEFVEMLPDTGLLENIVIEGIMVGSMLDKMNKRIAMLYDREHTVGHSYFLPLRESPTLEKLSGIFKKRIIPLLQEYFYDDYEKIRFVLGDNTTNKKECQFILAKAPSDDLFGNDTDRLCGNRKTYEVNDDALRNAQAYKKIYESAEQ